MCSKDFYSFSKISKNDLIRSFFSAPNFVSSMTLLTTERGAVLVDAGSIMAVWDVADPRLWYSLSVCLCLRSFGCAGGCSLGSAALHWLCQESSWMPQWSTLLKSLFTHRDVFKVTVDWCGPRYSHMALCCRGEGLFVCIHEAEVNLLWKWSCQYKQYPTGCTSAHTRSYCNVQTK